MDMKKNWWRTVRLLTATWRFALAHVPKWLLGALAVCALVPGPFDEILILLVLTALVVSSCRRRNLFSRYMRTAWRLA